MRTRLVLVPLVLSASLNVALAAEGANVPTVDTVVVTPPAAEPITRDWIEAAIAAALAKQTEALTLREKPILPSDPDRFVESNVVSLVGRDGFRWQDRAGQFLLNPYVLMQTRAQFVRHDDTYLELSDPDNLASAGFGIPNGILGVAGKAFGKLSFNLALNAACGGGCLLNEAWLEGNFSEAFRLRAGKFKTPMSWHVQTRLGSRLAAASPLSLATRVNLPADLNAVNPTLATGFDVGVQVHGRLGAGVEYQVGVWNGEGIQVNAATSTLADDTKVPALLYAGRLTYQPLGALAPEESGPEGAAETRLHLGASASYNVEANAESSNDLRAGIEFALWHRGWRVAGEGYLLHLRFTERLRGTPAATFLGAYTTISRSVATRFEPFLRLDAFDRNSTRVAGVLLSPAGGLNYYVYGHNLKVQALYQYTSAVGHGSASAKVDDLGDLGKHTFLTSLQFAL